jgi:hypothetical protein
MSTTRGVRTLVGIAVASSVILLGGCASSGTTGSTGGTNPLAGGSTSHSSAGTTGGSSSSSDGSSGGASDSSSSSDSSDSSGSSGSTGGNAAGGLGSDPGCQAAQADMMAGSKAMSNAATDPQGALSAIKDTAGKLHADAGKSSKPSAAAAINKLGSDYTDIATKAAAGQQPDQAAVLNDVKAMISACQG